jgi:hypothetical protein
LGVRGDQRNLYAIQQVAAMSAEVTETAADEAPTLVME